MGWSTDRVLQLHAEDAELQDYQSDRTYPPFFSSFQPVDVWLDPGSGVERQATQSTLYPGAVAPGNVRLNTEDATFLLRDTATVPAPTAHTNGLTHRALNPWAVLADWSADSAARVAGSCRYRDYTRVALTRRGPFGPELLLLDPKTGYPVAVIRTEPHYLWGQVRAEYVYSTWIETNGVAYPGGVFRLADGSVNISRSVSNVLLTPRDSAPGLTVPAGTPVMAPIVPGFLTPTPPDTVRVGPGTFLLRNRGYAEAVTLVRDTVFLFDATQGDERAQADSAWIGRLFPGKHPIVVVVTDLAWPHVAGVRFWVASGATIVSHRASKTFLEQVVNHRWTLAPDRLERSRAHARLIFRSVSDSLRLAAGAVTLYPIDGVSSEGALIGFLQGDRFLWASDYVQTLSEPSQYGREVDAAVRRVGVSPDKFAAEHLPLSEWEALQQVLSGAPRPGA
jgi:hypothetical protein